MYRIGYLWQGSGIRRGLDPQICLEKSSFVAVPVPIRQTYYNVKKYFSNFYAVI
jgi:hypothetical protein